MKRETKGSDKPDMASKMLAATEDHATVAIASALESLCGSGAIAFSDALSGGELLLGNVLGDRGEEGVVEGARGRRHGGGDEAWPWVLESCPAPSYPSSA